MKRFATFVAVYAAAIGAGSSASADIVPIAPFTGEAGETFENIIPPGPYSGPMPVFSGAATMDDEFTDPWIAFSLSGGGFDLFPYDGNLMGLTPTGWTVFDFDTPVLRFGGYFGIVNLASGGTVTFLDDGGSVIETQAFDLPQAEWVWRGWESDVPIGSVVVHAGANPGITTVFDNMQLSYVPEPGTLALLTLAAGAAALRRR